MDKISVIVPVYNVEKYLRKCLDSIVGQTYPNLEIIVIDDGSPDRCGEICDEYAQKDPRVRVMHKENAGVSAAWNDGIALARGDWISFVDSDDWLDTDYYACFMKELAGPEVDILCATGAIYEFPDYRVCRCSIPMLGVQSGRMSMDMMMARVLAPSYDVKGSRWVKFFVTLWDKIYRTSMIHENALQFEPSLKTCNDVLFNFSAFDVARAIQGCRGIGYHYRSKRSDSITNSFNPNYPNMFYSFIEKLHEHMAGREANSIIMDAIDVTALGTIWNLLRIYFFHPDNPVGYRTVAKEIREFKHREYMVKCIKNDRNQS